MAVCGSSQGVRLSAAVQLAYMCTLSPGPQALTAAVGSTGHTQRIPLDVEHPGHARWGEDLETDKALPEAMERAVAEQRDAVDVGLYSIVTSQCSSTALYQVSYHIQ
jgi:hypothetical protein